MALWNQIGPFQFLDLAGSPGAPQERSELLQRPGVDGSAIKLLGLQGAPFTLRSRVDAETVADAHAYAIDYQAIVNDGAAYGLAMHGVDYGQFDLEFFVLAVGGVRVSARLLTMGGLFPPSLGWLEADWTLLAAPIGA